MIRYARECLHGTLPFAKELIDAVLAEIPPVCHSGDIPLWEVKAVKLELCRRTGIRAEFFEDANDEFEFVSEDEGDDE